MIVFEAASGAVAAVWGALVTINLLRGRRLGRELDSFASLHVIDGIAVNVVRGAGRMALVLGTVRPRIYIGNELLSVLGAEERVGVLLHEDHHRAIHAPVRAAALEAWLSIVGRWASARRALLDRLTDIETMADTYAITNGCRRSALAAALLKSEPGLAGVSAVSYGAERRIRALLDRDHVVLNGQGLPYEWLPIAVFVVVAAACHVWGISILA